MYAILMCVHVLGVCMCPSFLYAEISIDFFCAWPCVFMFFVCIDFVCLRKVID